MFLLFLGTPLNQGITDHSDTKTIVRATSRQASFCELFCDNDIFIWRQTRAAIIGRPHSCQQLVVTQNSAPLADKLCFRVPGQRTNPLPIRRQVFTYETLDLVAIGLCFF